MQLREATREVHVKAERSGVVRELLTGQVSRPAYALFLRNVLPVYEALEAGLRRRSREPTIAVFSRPDLFRAPAIEADLAVIAGPDWERTLSIVPAASRYATLIEHAVSERSGAALLAHAYVRYFGDLSGGRILRRILATSLALGDEALAFYRFVGLDDPDKFKTHLRDALDEMGRSFVEPAFVIDEALRAFQANIALSTEVEAAGTNAEPLAAEARVADAIAACSAPRR